MTASERIRAAREAREAREARGMSGPTYEVWSMVEGTLEADSRYDDYDRARAAIATLEADYRETLPDAEWDIFLVPHYCNGDSDDDCGCVQYLTDHRPAVSSRDITGSH
jgi:hypothetical protein